MLFLKSVRRRRKATNPTRSAAWGLDQALHELAKTSVKPTSVKPPAPKKPKFRGSSRPVRSRGPAGNRSGSRQVLGRPGGRPSSEESKRRAPDARALLEYLRGEKAAGDVAKTAEVEICTIHVWRCGQKMLRALVKDGVVPEEHVSWRGKTMLVRPSNLRTPEVAAYVALL